MSTIMVFIMASYYRALFLRCSGISLEKCDLSIPYLIWCPHWDDPTGILQEISIKL